MPGCDTCRHFGEVGGGDWVDYGSTKTRLPIEYGCKEERDESISPCPGWQEQFKCKTHGDYLNHDGTCDQCYEDFLQELEDEHTFLELQEL